MERFFVIGFAADENELLIDIVAAESRDEAENWFRKYRPYCDHCEAFDQKWCDMIMCWIRRPLGEVQEDMKKWEAEAHNTYLIE